VRRLTQQARLRKQRPGAENRNKIDGRWLSKSSESRIDRGRLGDRPSFRSQDLPQIGLTARTANLNAANFVEKNHHSGLRHASGSLIQCGSIQTNVHDFGVILVDRWQTRGAQNAFCSAA
jgi:hypothetical protein